jgi:hypothetical protein
MKVYLVTAGAVDAYRVVAVSLKKGKAAAIAEKVRASSGWDADSARVEPWDCDKLIEEDQEGF